jgi:predicted metal-dependent enzyme (double-stranded beta helix superfamily)
MTNIKIGLKFEEFIMTNINKIFLTTVSIVTALTLITSTNAQEDVSTSVEKDYTMDSAKGMDGNIPNPCHMYYPNIPGELILENDKMVVQRFTIQPGQWEGIHRHPFDQLYVQIKGGEWTAHYGDEAATFLSPDGNTSWDPTGTTMAENHQSQNTGDEPMELVWIAMKPGCLVPN